MPTFQFEATQDPARPIQPGMVYRWTVNAPSIKEAKEISVRHRIGVEETQRHGIRYQVYELPARPKQATIVSVEKFFMNPVAAAPVEGGSPTGTPVAQKGQQRMDGQRSPDGFQEIGDPSLDLSQDGVYAPSSDGTYTDLLSGGMHGPSQEVPRG